jgi:hypothetical protein
LRGVEFDGTRDRPEGAAGAAMGDGETARG